MDQRPKDPSGREPAGVEPRDIEDEPLSQTSPESVSSGEEFLFHLYRGSELLQDNCISEAKEELEQALSMQPQDVEGQGLLGIVYFRLGLYPRAIKIYREIVAACPTELTPRINLALCYIKTGQLSLARRELEAVISRAPERKRAWGYLGLVFERMGDLHKARAAFERAAQEHMVLRMDRLLSLEQNAGKDSDHPERLEVRKAAADAFAELDTATGAPGVFSSQVSDAGPRSGHWRPLEPGEEAIPPPARPPHLALARDPDRPRTSLPPLSLSPPPPARAPSAPAAADLATESLLAFPDNVVVSQPSARSLLVHVREGFGVRQDTLGALLPRGEAFKSQVLMRRHRGHETSEPMGGHGAPFILLEGAGRLVLKSSLPLQIVHVHAGFIYVRENALVGFETTVRYEHGRLSALGDEAVSIVQLSGRGVVAFERHGKLRSLSVSAEQPVTIRARLVLGWTGRMLTGPLEPKHAPNQVHGFVTFTGDGAIFLEIDDDEQ